MSPSETDPLLPQGNTAPEISGYGFSKSTKTHDQARHQLIHQSKDVDDKGSQQTSQRDVDLSPFRILVALFIIVIGFAIFIVFLLRGAWNAPWQAPGNESSSIQARVDKILMENPLIGL